jgi:hypothetical protein
LSISLFADIFNKFNDLNLLLQGFDKNIFKAREKVKGFYKKLLFWINCVNNGNVAVFPTVFELTEQNEVSVTDGVLEIIKCHLENLRIQFFCSRSLVTLPFHTSCHSHQRICVSKASPH